MKPPEFVTVVGIRDHGRRRIGERGGKREKKAVLALLVRQREEGEACLRIALSYFHRILGKPNMQAVQMMYLSHSGTKIFSPAPAEGRELKVCILCSYP